MERRGHLKGEIKRAWPVCYVENIYDCSLKIHPRGRNIKITGREGTI